MLKNSVSLANIVLCVDQDATFRLLIAWITSQCSKVIQNAKSCYSDISLYNVYRHPYWSYQLATYAWQFKCTFGTIECTWLFVWNNKKPSRMFSTLIISSLYSKSTWDVVWLSIKICGIDFLIMSASCSFQSFYSHTLDLWPGPFIRHRHMLLTRWSSQTSAQILSSLRLPSGLCL